MRKVRRRHFLLATGGLLAAPSLALSQQSQSMRRIAVLSTARPQGPTHVLLSNQLRQLGYEEGRNLAIDWRFTIGKSDQLPRIASELVGLNPELIIAHTSPSIAVLKPLTRTIPIVMYAVTHPVEYGFVESLARPGGNITGVAWSGEEQIGKVLQILKEAAPKAIRVALLGNPANPFAHLWNTEAERAARHLGITLQHFPVTRLEDVEPALERIAVAKPDALCLRPDGVTHQRTSVIAAFTIERKLVSISISAVHAERGGLFYYGPDESAIAQRVVSLMDRILRGAKPAELPVELPSKYEFIINAKTAQVIGYKIPQSLLARADRVIE